MVVYSAALTGNKGTEMKTTITALLKTIARIFLLAVITPALYFAWRVNQPMDLPDFNGLSYLDVQEWQKMELEERAVWYETAYPNDEYRGPGKTRVTACTISDIPLAAFVTIKSVLSAWAKEDLRVKFLDQGMPDRPVTFWNLLPSLWNTYEKLTLTNIRFKQKGRSPIAWCNIPSSIPTREEFDAMKLDNASYVSARRLDSP